MFLRFEKLRNQLVQNSSLNDVLANHACIIKTTKTVLTLGISEGFKLEHIQDRLQNPEVREFFFSAFPDLKKITTIAKPKDSIFESYIERKHRLREEKRHNMAKLVLSDKQYKLLNQMIPTDFSHFTLEEENRNDHK